MKDFLRDILDENGKSRISISVSFLINALILLTLVSFSLETLPDLNETFRKFLHGFEVFIVAVFTLEYLARVWVAEKRFQFVFSFYGVIDLLAIMPFYLALGIDLRSVRAIRLLRLFRLLKVGRYSDAITRAQAALLSIKEELVMFLMLVLLLLYLSATGIYFFENQAQPDHFTSIFHSLWWSVATLTTVGYGDVYPITVGGRIFTFIILMIGLGLVAVPSGLIASALTNTVEGK